VEAVWSGFVFDVSLMISIRKTEIRVVITNTENTITLFSIDGSIPDPENVKKVNKSREMIA